MANKFSAFQSLMQRLEKWYLLVRAVLHSVWLVLNHFLWEDKFFRKQRLRRKILIVGDEGALGYGDWIICSQTPGSAKHLQHEIKAGGHVRFTWRVFTCAHIGSTSEEWHPECKARPAFMGFTVRAKNLFEKAFGERGRHADCDAVVLNIGANDTSTDPEETARNVGAVVDELLSRGKRVWVNTLPIRGHLEGGKARRGWVLSERNAALKRMVAQKQKTNDHVYFGVDVEGYKRNELFCFDGVHLSSRGYRRVAKELYPLMKNPLLNIEWLFLRPELSEKLREKGNAFMADEVMRMGSGPPRG